MENHNKNNRNIQYNKSINSLKEETQAPGENQDKKDAQTPNTVGNIKELGSSTVPLGSNNSIHCLTIVGQIEGHIILPPQNKTTKYEHIIPQLIAIEESNEIEGFVVIMNTVGGDVEAGLAIAEMISSMTKPSVSVVLGGGHSIGVPMAVSANYSFITPTATMTIHPIRMSGLIISVPQTYEYFNKMQERVVKFVTDHSRITREEFNNLMLRTGELANDIGTVLVGEEAVNCGLINEIGGLSNAIQKLKSLINEKKGS